MQQVRAAYRQDWLVDPQMPLAWRLQKEHAGSGALGDIGAHIVDMTQFVTGQAVEAVSGVGRHDREAASAARRAASGLSGTAGEGYGEVTVDDVAIFTGRLSGGALVSFEATRFATGRKNALTIEVSGDQGALAFDLEDLNSLQFYDRTAPADRQGFTKILVTEAAHPYVGRVVAGRPHARLRARLRAPGRSTSSTAIADGTAAASDLRRGARRAAGARRGRAERGRRFRLGRAPAFDTRRAATDPLSAEENRT